MSDHDTPIVIRADIDDLVALLPYLLGYHPNPDGDLAVIALDGGQVTLVARADLPTPAQSAAAIAHVCAMLTGGHDGIVIVGYGPAPLITPVIDRFRAHCQDIDLAVIDALRVTDARMYSYLCANPNCHPVDGTPVPATTPATLTALTAGLTATADRTALATRIAAVTGAARTSMSTATARMIDAVIHTGTPALIARGTPLLAAAATVESTGWRPCDDEVATLGLLAELPGFTDEALRRLPISDAQVDLWSDITRRVDPTFAAGPAAILSYLAWRRGAGTLARIAVERAITADAEQSLALLMDRVLRVGMPPGALAAHELRRNQT
jgi:hypothetical protein